MNVAEKERSIKAMEYDGQYRNNQNNREKEWKQLIRVNKYNK